MAKSKKKHKTNPNHIPCSQADVDRAKDKAKEDTLKLAFAICLYVLKDKFAFDDERLARAVQWLNSTADSVSKGYIKWRDIADILKDDYDITMYFYE